MTLFTVILVVLVVLAFLLGVLLYLRAMSRDMRAQRERFNGELDLFLNKYRASQEADEALLARLDTLEHSTLPIVGVDQGEKTWSVTVGGEEVEVRAMPPVEWARALEELPGFLIAHAAARSEKKEMKPEDLASIFEKAKRWIAACAAKEVRLERLTAPEALHAVVVISRLNGMDQHLAAWFRERLGHDAAGPGGQTLRGAAQPTSKVQPRRPVN